MGDVTMDSTGRLSHPHEDVDPIPPRRWLRVILLPVLGIPLLLCLTAAFLSLIPTGIYHPYGAVQVEAESGHSNDLPFDFWKGEESFAVILKVLGRKVVIISNADAFTRDIRRAWDKVAHKEMQPMKDYLARLPVDNTRPPFGKLRWDIHPMKRYFEDDIGEPDVIADGPSPPGTPETSISCHIGLSPIVSEELEKVFLDFYRSKAQHDEAESLRGWFPDG
jgi:hypothetical protein